MDNHRRHRPARAAARGFTIIELLIVLALIGVIAGVAIVNFSGAADRAKVKATQTRISSLKAALNLYFTEFNAYPPTDGLDIMLPNTIVEGGLGYLEADGTLDSWDRPLVYFNGFEGHAWMIASSGPDGQEGTADDIIVTPEG